MIRLLQAMRRSIRGRFSGVAVAAAVMLFAAAPVLAQESSSSLTDSTSGWAFRWINFALLAAILVYGFAKAAPKFRKNSEEISRKIAEGTRAREAAEQQRREVRTKMAGIDAEVAAMREDAQRGAQAEAERIRALAKSEAEMIERAAQAEIAAAERASRLELRAAAARLAVERAEALLREQLTPSDESALFRTFVAELERSAN
jgi:F0F1-type ATP synthase membrane subunit b/b'